MVAGVLTLMKAAFVAGSLSFLAGSAYSQQSEVPGAGGYTTESPGAGFDLMGVSLHNPVALSGTFDSDAGATLTDADVDFSAVLTDPNATYLLEILDGTQVGAVAEIESLTATTVTVGASGLGAGAAAYQIRAAYTLENIFGDSLAGAVAVPGATTDRVWVPRDGGGFDHYFRHTGSGQYRSVALPFAATTDPPVFYPDALFVQVADTAKEVTYFVAPGGDDGGWGTIGSPLKTIQAAVDLSKAGDTIEIRGGTYRELIRPRPANTGIEGSPITIRAYDPDGAGPLSPESVTISGFEPIVPGANGAGQWIDLADGSGIWKIQLTTDHGIPAPGLNQVSFNGTIMRRERFPNAPSLDFDYRTMAAAEEGSGINGNVDAVPALYQATYEFDSLPAGDWSGARILTSPGVGLQIDSGNVLSNDADSLSFSYRVVGHYNHANEGDPFYLYNSLLALDEPGEAFYDVEGISGIANTLYLIPPPGDAPTQVEVELRSMRRHPGSPSQVTNSALWFTNGVGHFVFEDLNILGAGVYASTGFSSNLSFRRVAVSYGSLSGTSVSLTSADNVFEDGSITRGLGQGITIGSKGSVRNNVFSKLMREAIVSTGPATRIEYNTLFELGGIAITLSSKGGVVSNNNAYQCAMLRADIAALNSCSQGDLQGLEVSYNWVHTSNGRFNAPLGWLGCLGIRLDGGCGYPGASNFLVHHNLVCGVSSPYDLVVYGLQEGYPNYGDTKLKVYNNTVEGFLLLSKDGNFSGTDVRNNIAGNFFGRESALNSITTLEDNQFEAKSIVGNITGLALFEAPGLGNYLLTSESPGLDLGQDLGALTSGHLGIGPDLGAFEFGSPSWVAGAKMAATDLVNLAVSQYLNFGCSREIRVVGMPKGRMLPQEFKLRIGSQESTLFRHEIGADGHVSSAVMVIDTSSLEGTQAVSYSMDGITFEPGGMIEMIDCALGISAIVPRATDPSGGTFHSIDGSGLTGYDRPLIPIHFVNLAASDLQTVPVPVIFDSSHLILSGQMQPDGADLRIIEFPSVPGGVPRELEYWIESGLNTTTTLIWIRNPGGTSSLGVDVFLSFGELNTVAQSDPAVLTDYFDELALPSLELKLTADSLAGTLLSGQDVLSWQDSSGQGNDAVQSNPGKAPHFAATSVSGLPAVQFDGIDDYLFVGDGIGPNKPQSTFIVYWNPDPYIDPENSETATQRLVSANHSPTGDWLTDPATGTRGLAQNATIDASQPLPVPSLADFRSAGTFNFANFTIGADYLYRDNPWWGKWFKGYVCEVLVFTEDLVPNSNPDINDVREYLLRKWGMNGSARGFVDPAELIAPIEVWIDGQSANFDIVNGSIVFEAPPHSGSSELLPASADVEIRKGEESEILLDSFFYFLSSYPSWEGAPPLNLDADGDGHTSLFEYAYGADPAWPEYAIGPVLAPLAGYDDGRCEFQFRRNINATDLMIWIEFSDDLESWIREPISRTTMRIVDPDVTGDGSTQLVGVELPFEPGTARQFARLVVELIQ